MPRLFAQEAITVARSSFVTEPTAARALPDMVLLGDLPASPFPSLDGYNLTYLRPGATMGVVTTDEYKAPVLAFWHRGLGRVASLTAEVDGQYSQRLNAWRDFQGFSGRTGPLAAGRRAAVRRAGQHRTPRRSGHRPRRARSRRARAAAPTTCARRRRRSCRRTIGAEADRERLTLAWVGDRHARSAFPDAEGRHVPRRRPVGDRRRAAARAAEPSLLAGIRAAAGSRRRPEHAARDRAASPAASSGRRGTTCSTSSRLRNRQMRDLVMPLTLMLLVLHVAEIGGRRLLLFAAARGWLRTVRVPRLRPASSRPADAAPDRASAPSGEAPRVAPPVAPPKPASSALARAKARARDRMGR